MQIWWLKSNKSAQGSNRRPAKCNVCGAERKKNERWSDHVIHQAPGEVSHLRVYVGAYGWFANMWVVNLQQPQCIAASSAKQDTRYVSFGESCRQVERETKQQPSDPSASPSCPRAVNSIALFSAGPRGQVTWPRVHPSAPPPLQKNP